MESLWRQRVQIERRPALKGEIEAEAVVVGAGMAGILTAWFLERAGIRTVVLEAKRIGGGQTQNTTAKITSQHGLFYADLIKEKGEEKAGLYAQANEEAIRMYRQIVEEKKISCSFCDVEAYLYSCEGKENLQKEEAAAKQLGIRAALKQKSSLPFPVEGLLCFKGQAEFEPLSFIKALAEELEIYEDSQVLSVEGDQGFTRYGKVRAENFIFATHYPSVRLPGCYFMRLHQERSYCLALQQKMPFEGMYYGIDKDGISLRGFENYLILGGGSHRTGENPEGGQYQRLKEFAGKWWPESPIVAAWSAQDCISADKLPYIGRYAGNRPGWYAATGFKKWGMTSSMIAARLITDLIQGKKNPYEEVFAPQRFSLMPAGANILKEGFHAVKGLIKNKEGLRCPHMGCGLVWNPEENTYDCPCHGSRFDRDGRLLDNPAQKGIVIE